MLSLVRSPAIPSRLLVLLGLALLVGLSYYNSFGSGLVLDNEFIIREDPRLRAVTWENLRLIFTEDYWYPKGVSGLYRPLVTLSFLVEYSVFGFADRPVHYHWINVLLHLANSYLASCLVRRLSLDPWAALGAAALFAVHPIGTESVTNLIGRSDLIATTCVVGGLLAYLQAGEAEGRWRWGWYSLLALILAIGVFAKESAIVLVLILPIYDTLFAWKPTPPALSSYVRFIRDRFTQRYIVVVPVVLLLFSVRYWMWREHGPSMLAWGDNPLRSVDFLSARLTAIKIIGYYLGLLSFPPYLSCDYTFDAIPISTWRFSGIEDFKAILAAIGIAILAWISWMRFRRGHQAECFFFLWFFVALLPTSNLLFLIDSNMAERFLYLPMVGFCGYVAIFCRSALSRWPRVLAVGATIALLIVLCWRTHLRNKDWHSNLTLWTSAAEVCPESVRVQRSLAWAMYQEKGANSDFDPILPIAEKAASIAERLPTDRGDERTHLFLGIFHGFKADQLSTLDANGQTLMSEEARQHIVRSVEAFEYAQLVGEQVEAAYRQSMLRVVRHPEKIGRTGPSKVYENLWVSYSRLGKHEQAVSTLRKLQAIRPLTPTVYQKLPDELALSGQVHQAGIVILQGILLGLQSDVAMQQLETVYSQSPPTSPPPLLRENNLFQFNLEHPQLQADFDEAIRQLIELLLIDKNLNSAIRVRQAASDLGRPLAPIERQFELLGPGSDRWTSRQ